MTDHACRIFKKKLASKNIVTTVPGKGRNVWFCFGYMIASNRSEAIALHDADIITYNREMLARLVYPVADPSFNFKYCKGYYFRTDDEKLHGPRCSFTGYPAVTNLKKNYLAIILTSNISIVSGIRLQANFSMRADIIKTIRIPYDWGLEIGILNEVERKQLF